MTTTPNFQQSPYLREQRQYPTKDVKELASQSDHAYIDIAQKVNSRTIGLFAINNPIITGESWYLSGSSQKQQTLRQVYPFFGITAATQANPAVLTIPGNDFQVGQTIDISNVDGMVQLNLNSYTIIDISGDLVTIQVDSSGFGAYTSNGTAINPHGINFATITGFTRIYGTYLDNTGGGDDGWHGFPSGIFDVTITSNFTNLQTSRIVINGWLVLEWLSQF